MKILITCVTAFIIIWMTLAGVSCTSMPPVTVEGQYGTYRYDSKGGLVVTPHLLPYHIKIHADK